MAIYYVLLITSALIWALTFLFTKQYQKYKGEGLVSSLKMSCISSAFIALMFYVKLTISLNEFTFYFTWFTFAITFAQAFVVFAGIYIGMKVLSVGDMSLYSMFMMLGSLILPTLTGFLYGEAIDDRKIIGMILMIVALVLSLDSVEKKRMSLKVALYYFAAFVANGMMGVFLTIHQKNPELTAGAYMQEGSWAINSDAYMVWYGLSAVLMSSVFLGILKVTSLKNERAKALFVPQEGLPVVQGNLLKLLVALIPVGYGLFCGFGDYFISLATVPGALGASVTFPINNGGTIVFSTLVGLIVLKEKINLKTILSLIIILCSTMLFMFAPV